MKHFSRSLAWLTVSELLFNLSAYIVHAFAGRILGPADYGRYGLVVTLTTMIIVLIGNGIPTAMSKYLSEILETNPERIAAIRRKTAFIQSGVIALVTILFFLLAPVLAWVLRDPSLTPLFQLSSLIIPAFAAASFYHHYFVGLHLFVLQSLTKIFRSIARVAIIVGLAILFGLPGAITGYILAPLITFVFAWLLDRFYVVRRLGLGKTIPDAFSFSGKTLLSYAGPLTLFLIFYELILTLDLYFVKAMLGNDHLTGLYNAAITVGRIPYYLFAALAMLLLPAISKTTAEKNDEETQTLIGKSLRLLVLILVPLISSIALYARQALHFFYGDRYVGAEAALQVFTLGVGALTVFYVLAFALNGAGRVKTSLWLSIFGFLIMLGLNFALIPSFGIVGAAWATTLSSIIVMIAVLIRSEQIFDIALPWRLIFASLLLAPTVFLGGSSFLPNGNWSFIASTLILGACYYWLLYFFKALTKEDLAPLLRKFGSIKK